VVLDVVPPLPVLDVVPEPVPVLDVVPVEVPVEVPEPPCPLLVLAVPTDELGASPAVPD